MGGGQWGKGTKRVYLQGEDRWMVSKFAVKGIRLFSAPEFFTGGEDLAKFSES